MQTKKKNGGRNSARDHATPKVSRPQRKVSENVQISERKVADLITSSARKQRFADNLQKKGAEPVATTNLIAEHSLLKDGEFDACLGCDARNDTSMHVKGYNDGNDNLLPTIFSPAFLISKNVEETATEGHSIHQMEILHDHATSETSDSICQGVKSSCENTRLYIGTTCASYRPVDPNIEGTNLSTEVSAIYFAMKNSKLECIDERGQDSMSAEVYYEDEDSEEFDEFDPYLFIKNLPDLSSVVPSFRPMLLPKQTRSCPPTTLVLDLDETLVHSSLVPCDDADFTFMVNFNLSEHTVYVRCRPHLRDFMERVANLFEIIIFTASQSIYAEQLLNVLDPKRRIFRHRVYRESCVFVDGNYLKDLSVLGRDLARVIIIDNSPQAFGFQVDNGIPIESWFDDRSDQELLLLLPFLESLVGVEDVRPLIAEKFSLREKVAAAVYPSINPNVGDPFES